MYPTEPLGDYTNHTRRDGREAEGAPLLREYTVKSCIEGSNPSLTAIFYASIAQLDRVLGYEPSGRRFESSWMHHSLFA